MPLLCPESALPCSLSTPTLIGAAAVIAAIGAYTCQPLIRGCGPSLGADVAGVCPVSVQMWQGCAQSRCRCGRRWAQHWMLHAVRACCTDSDWTRESFMVLDRSAYLGGCGVSTCVISPLSSKSHVVIVGAHARTHGTHRCVRACRVARRIRLVPSPIAIAAILVAIRLLQASTAASAYVERLSQSSLRAVTDRRDAKCTPHAARPRTATNSSSAGNLTHQTTRRCWHTRRRCGSLSCSARQDWRRGR